MISILTHFRLNRILMLAIGLWPYQQSKLVQLQLMLFFSILVSFLVVQLTTLMTTKCTPELIIKVSSFILFFSILLIVYHAFWINIQPVKYLFEQLQHICNELKDKNEIAIIKKCGIKTKQLTTKITSFGIGCMCIVVFVPLWPRLLDVILPMNESRPRFASPVMTEYFVDQDKYFSLILLHVDAAACIGTLTVTGVGTILIGYLTHICGMFTIASYRIEQAMMINRPENTSLKKENEIIIRKKISCAVDIHRKAMEFAEHLVIKFEGSCIVLIATSVSCMSLSLYGVALKINNLPELCIHVIGVLVFIIAIFITNNVAQDITDHNNHIFVTVYNVQWYMAPLHVQKMVLFLLQRGTKTFYLHLGGLFIGSLETAATLTSASISYFTVLYSIRQ